MNYRTTFILGGIFLSLLILLVVAVSFGPEGEDQGRSLFPELIKTTGVDVSPSESIVGVRLERATPAVENIQVQKDPGSNRWVFEQPFQGPADSFAINSLIRAVVEGRREDDRDARVAQSQTGLDKPTATVRLTDKSGKEHVLKVGSTIPGATAKLVFVRASGRGEAAQVMVERDLDPVFRPLGALRERNLLGAETDIEGFQLSTGPVGPKPVVSLKKTAGVWRYESPAYGLADAGGLPVAGQPSPGGEDVGSILRSLGQIRVDQVGEKPGDRNDFLADGVADPGSHGLDPAKNKVLKIVVERNRSAAEKAGPLATQTVLLVGLDKLVEKEGTKPTTDKDKKDSPDKDLAGSKAAGFKGYPAMVEGSGSVVLVPAGPVDALVKLLDNPGMVRDRAVMRVTGEPDWIEIQNGLGKLDLVKVDAQGGYKLFRPGVPEPLPVEPVALTALLEAFRNARGVFTADTPEKRVELELEKPQDRRVFLRVWTGAVEPNPKESKDGKSDGKKPDPQAKPARKDIPPSAEVVFGKRQGEDVAILRVSGKDQAVLLAPKNLLDLAEQGALAYLDRKIPSFAGEGVSAEAALDQVIGVSLTRGGETIAVSRKDKADAWKFTAPANRASLKVDPQVIRSLLVNLGTLQARKLVQEKADKQALTSQGLEPPALLLTLQLAGADGKPQTRTLALGKESGDGGVFAHASWRDWVFTLDLSIRSILESPWENKALFPDMDPAKVSRVKLTGWQVINGAPVSLVLERDKGQWVAREPSTDFPVAQAKVDGLLQSLKSLRFEKVIAYAGGGDPSLGLDPAKNGLVIEWTVEGAKEPVKLILGKPEGTGLAGAVSTLPGMAVVVPRVPFEEALQGRGKFRQ